MDHLQSLRVFVKVAEIGTFTGASESLDLSSTVTTRLVAALEERLRVRLFQRTTRRGFARRPMHGCEQYRNAAAFRGRRSRHRHAARLLVATEIASGHLVRLLPDRVQPPIGMNLVFMSRRNLAAKVRTFVDFMVEQFAANPDGVPGA